MLLDTTKNQKFLETLYMIQQSKSNHVRKIATAISKIETQKVYRAYDYIKQCNIYALNPISDVLIAPEKQVGGRPRVLSDEQQAQIKIWTTEGVAKREMARRLGVSDWTIRCFLNGD